MDLTNEFDVPASVDDTWEALTDIERIAPCMPGATLTEVEGDAYRGTVKVKVGPITAKFKGEASFVEQDASAHRAVLKASGRDTGGKGNASATITAQLTGNGGSDGEGEGTHVSIVTDLSISGKVAQFGRSAMADISTKLIGQFVDCLETDILGRSAASDSDSDSDADSDESDADSPSASSTSPAAAASSPSSPSPATTSPNPSQATTTTSRSDAGDDGATGAPAGPRRIDGPEAAPIDLVDTAGATMAKALVPAGLIAIVLIWLLRRRRS